MTPGLVSGLYFAHPQAHYFGVGKIERDQLEDYARRKGWTGRRLHARRTRRPPRSWPTGPPPRSRTPGCYQVSPSAAGHRAGARHCAGLEAARDIAIAGRQPTGLERVLELVVNRGRALIDVRSVVIMLCDGPDLVVTASAGEPTDVRGHRVPIAASTSGEVLERRRPERIADVAARLRIAPSELGVHAAHTALLVPMVARGEAIGVLAAFDRAEQAEQIHRRGRAAAAPPLPPAPPTAVA
jgi:hypothetical protein